MGDLLGMGDSTSNPLELPEWQWSVLKDLEKDTNDFWANFETREIQAIGRMVSVRTIDEPPSFVEEQDRETTCDIELVMYQVECSEEEAIAAINKHNGDIVSAIMELS